MRSPRRAFVSECRLSRLGVQVPSCTERHPAHPARHPPSPRPEPNPTPPSRAEKPKPPRARDPTPPDRGRGTTQNARRRPGWGDRYPLTPQANSFIHNTTSGCAVAGLRLMCARGGPRWSSATAFVLRWQDHAVALVRGWKSGEVRVGRVDRWLLSPSLPRFAATRHRLTPGLRQIEGLRPGVRQGRSGPCRNADNRPRSNLTTRKRDLRAVGPPTTPNPNKDAHGAIFLFLRSRAGLARNGIRLSLRSVLFSGP